MKKFSVMRRVALLKMEYLFMSLDRKTAVATINAVFILLLPVILIACGSSSDDLNHYINTIKSRPAKPIEPIPAFAQLSTFSYPENVVRRNPFIPLSPKQQEDLFEPNSQRPKQPLEAFPLDTLKFVGILRQDGKIWGLIMQPGGLVSRIKVGDYMGQNYGQVLAIKDKWINLEETIKINGKWKKRGMIINLRTPT